MGQRATSTPAKRAAPAKPAVTVEQVCETANSAGRTLRVDREAGIIHGAKLLGLTSGNGRDYTRTALEGARSLYEGAKLNLNHPDTKRPNQPRDYRDRFGRVKNVVLESDGLYGDLHINPRHPNAEQLFWDAENAPENVGCSPNHVIRTVKRNGRTVVEAIQRVNSVDVVADPATTKTLFEGEGYSDMDPALMDPAAPAAPPSEDMTLTMFLEKATEIFNGDGEAADKAKRIAALAKTLLKVADDIEAAAAGAPEAPAGGEGEGGGEGGGETEALPARFSKEINSIKAELDAYKVREKLAQKRARVTELVTEAKLPAEAVTDTFRQSLESAADEAAIKKLIEDRKALLNLAPRVRSREQTAFEARPGTSGSAPADAPKTAKEFAQSITRKRFGFRERAPGA